MLYKLYDETGDYRDKITKEPKNLCSCEIAISADGINVGWFEFDTIEEAIAYYGIEKLPIEENYEIE